MLDSFPKDFLRGVAAASYQIEGAWNEDGKGPSVWDEFCRKPGAVWMGQTGNVACDHYHRFPEDIALMKTLGAKAYRLSISWPRVLPTGAGSSNPQGLDFYDRLIDSLLAAGVEPYITLFHWDYPYDLYCRGGWLNPCSSDWFADYTSLVVKRLSDRVSHWMTLNEPQVFLSAGHQEGRHAPGLRLDIRQVLLATHNTLLAHGKSVQAIRANAVKAPVIGFVPIGSVHFPATNQPADIEAARHEMFSVKRKDMWNASWFSDPIFFKHYPADGVTLYGADMPDVRPGDMDIIAQPLDFYGVNIYTGTRIRAGANGQPEQTGDAIGGARTAYNWTVSPESLYWGPRFLWERYKTPIIITENGMANVDWVGLDGKVHDPQRMDYLRRYLNELRRAITDGVDVRGYFYWSILDNFEWAVAYQQRFGIVHVDYSTQVRTPKESYYLYQRIIQENRVVLD
jgi:beta-glucosidase